MSEMGNFATGYIELFEQYQNLAAMAQIETNPEVAAALNESVELALLQLDFFENEGREQTAEELREVIDFTPEIDEAVETQRRRLQLLLDDPARKMGPISDDAIRSRLEKLPPTPTGFSVEIKDVAVYALTNAFGASLPVARQNVPTPAVETSVPTREPAFKTPAPQESSNPIKNERPHLPVILTKDYVLQFPDASYLPLRRSKEYTIMSDADERFIAATRGRMLQVLSQNPNQKYSGRELWDLSVPGGVQYDKLAFFSYLSMFLKESTYQGRQLVNVLRSSEKSKIVAYTLGDYQLDIVSSESSSEYVDTNTFTLGDGGYLTGRRARLMHALLKTSKNSPLTFTDFNSSGIISADERDDRPISNKTYNDAIGALRTRLKAAGLRERYIIHRVLPKDKIKTTKPSDSAYWLETIDIEADKLAEHIRLRDAAQCLVDNEDILKELSLEPLDNTVLRPLNGKANGESDTSFQDRLDAFLSLATTETVERLMDDTVDPNDPVFKLIELLCEFTEDSQSTLLHDFEAAVRQKSAHQSPEPVPLDAASPTETDQTEKKEQLQMVLAAATPNVVNALDRLRKTGYLQATQLSPTQLNTLFPTVHFRKLRGGSTGHSVQYVLKTVVASSEEIKELLDLSNQGQHEMTKEEIMANLTTAIRLGIDEYIDQIRGVA